MEEKIKIDRYKCVGCGACIDDCPTYCLDFDRGKAAFIWDSCIECGHCYAICPVDAVEMIQYDTTGLGEYTQMTDIDNDQFLCALKSRRSVRDFDDRPIEEEKIRKILEAGRYAPTANNDQDLTFTILGSKQKAVEEACISYMRRTIKLGNSLSKNMRDRDIKRDFLFGDAPLVIVVSSPKEINKGFAAVYMELMAESLGLGVLYSGYTEGLINKVPKIRKMVHLPEGHKVCGVLVIGYPDVRYKRIVPRKDIDLQVL